MFTMKGKSISHKKHFYDIILNKGLFIKYFITLVNEKNNILGKKKAGK